MRPVIRRHLATCPRGPSSRGPHLTGLLVLHPLRSILRVLKTAITGPRAVEELILPRRATHWVLRVDVVAALTLADVCGDRARSVPGDGGSLGGHRRCCYASLTALQSLRS